MVEAEPLSSALGKPHRFSVGAYHRMMEAGILGEDDPVELLEGVIVEMAPQGVAHARIITRLTRLLVLHLGETHDVRPQLPLTLGEDSEPEPDLAVVPAGSEPPGEHPRKALLVVEVGSESLARDRGVKAQLYARAGIPEYWIIDVGRSRIEIYREPDMAQGRYRSQDVLAGDSVLECQTLPGVSFRAARLFE